MSPSSPVIEALPNPFQCENTTIRYFCDGVFGDTENSVRLALNARNAIPDINSKFQFVSDMLASNGNSGQCMVIAAEGAADVSKQALAYWCQSKEVANTMVNVNNRTILLKGPVIKVFTSQRDAAVLAANMAHEGIHQLSFNAGLHPTQTLIGTNSVVDFYSAYLKDSAPLAKTGTSALNIESSAGLLFKAPRQHYYNPAVQNSLAGQVTPQELNMALKEAELAFLNHGSEFEALKRTLRHLDIPEGALKGAHMTGNGIRSAEIPALIATSDIVYPGVAQDIIPNTYKVNETVMQKLIAMSDSERPFIQTPDTFHYYDPKLKSYQGLPIQEIIPDTVPPSIANKIWTNGLKVGGKILHFGLKALPYIDLSARVAGEYYLNNQPITNAVVNGATQWGIDIGMFSGLAPIIGSGPAAMLLVAANICDLGPDLITLHKEQLAKAPDISGMNALEAKQALDDFYMLNPYAKPETLLHGAFQRILAHLSARSIHQNVVNPLIKALDTPHSLDSVPLPTFDGSPGNQLTPENQQTLDEYRCKISPLFDIEDYRTEEHLLAQKKAELLASQKGAVPNLLPDDLPANPDNADLSQFNQTLKSQFGLKAKNFGQDTNQQIFNCPMDSPLLQSIFAGQSPEDIHAFLSNLSESDAHAMIQTELAEGSTDLGENAKETTSTGREKDTGGTVKEPFIKDVKIGQVGGSIGLIVTLTKGGVIGFAPQSGGFFVSITVEFTKDFMMAFASAAGIGLAIAGVAFVAQHFYNQHKRHVLEGIQKSFSNTEKDLAFINRVLEDLGNRIVHLSDADVIKEIKGILQHNNGKINKALDRAMDARKAKKPEYANAQNAAARRLAATNFELRSQQEQIRLQQVSNTFIENNASATSEDLLQQAKGLTSKASLTTDDIAKLEGINRLLRQKAANLVAQGKTTEAEKVLSGMQAITYFLPGNIATLHFGAGMGTVDRLTTGDLTTVNNAIKNINEIISKGGDPREAIKDLIDHMDNREGVRGNLKDRKGDRNDPKAETGHKPTSDDYVNCQQWDARIEAYDNFRAQLGRWLEQYENGNPPQSFEVDELSSHVAILSEMNNQSVNVWLKTLQDYHDKKNQDIGVTEQDIYTSGYASYLISQYLRKSLQTGVSSDILETAKQFEQLSMAGDERAAQIKTAAQKLFDNKDKGTEFWLKQIGALANRDGEMSLSDGIVLGYANKEIWTTLFEHIGKGEFEQAKLLSADLQKEDPAQKETLQSVSATLTEGLTHHNKQTEFWLRQLADANGYTANQTNQAESSDVNAAHESTANPATSETDIDDITAGVSKVSVKDNTDVNEVVEGVSKVSLEEVQSDTANTPPPEADGAPESKPLSQEPTQDEPLSLADTAKRGVALYQLSQRAGNLEKLGFAGKSRDLYQEMMKRDKLLTNDPKLSAHVDDLSFQHQGQVISLIIRPFQSAFTDYVAGLESGFGKTSGQVVIESINLGQTVCPNGLTLMIQGGHANWTGDFTVFSRNSEKVLEGIATDLKNPAEVYLAMKEGFQSGYETSLSVGMKQGIQAGWQKASFTSTMMYGQLAIMGIRATALLDPLIPERYQKQFAEFQKMRAQVVYYGSKGIEVAWGGNAAFQLIKTGGQAANAPMLAASVVKIGFDGVCWLIHWHQSSKGEACENSSRYQTEESVSSSLGAVGGTLALSLIAGPFGFWGGTILFGGGAIYHNDCKSTKQNCGRKALQGALSNIRYWEEQSPGRFTHDSSYNNMGKELHKHFNEYSSSGYLWDREAGPNAVENVARLAIWTNKIKELYNQKLPGFKDLKLWSEPQAEGDKLYIDSSFKIPAHFAYQGLCGLILPAWVDHQLSDFHSKYMTYSKGMYETCSADWHSHNWEQVREALTNVHHYAVHKYVEAAQNEKNLEKREAFLNSVRLDFSYSSKTWSEQLSDGHKFAGAALWHELNQKEKRNIFLDSFDVVAFIKTTAKPQYTQHAALMLEDAHGEYCRKILADENREALGVNNELITHHILKMIKAGQLEEARAFAEKVDGYGKSLFYRDFQWYFKPSQSNPVTALDFLMKEVPADRGLSYWRIMYNILAQCASSSKYAPNDSSQEDNLALFYGLLKLCADEIQKHAAITPGEKESTAATIKVASQYLKIYVNQQRLNRKEELLSDDALHAAVEALYQKGHATLRGEDNMPLPQLVNQALYQTAYTVNTGLVSSKKIPIEVAPNGECAFSTLGISRQEAVDLLVKAVQADIKPSKFKALLNQLFKGTESISDTLHNSVFHLLLDELEHLNNSIFSRSPENKETNRKLVLEYIHDQIAKPGYWLHAFQGQAGVFDAIALLLRKNLKIWISDDKGSLTQFNSIVYNRPDFETTDVLITNAEGFSKRNQANHYVLLVSAQFQVEELDVQQDIGKDDVVYQPELPKFTPGFLNQKGKEKQFQASIEPAQRKDPEFKVDHISELFSKRDLQECLANTQAIRSQIRRC